MRLDKYIADTLIISRTEAAAMIRAGHVTADGKTVRKADFAVKEKSALVTVDGSPLSYRPFIYIMMNKPQGVVSATDDKREKTVLSLLPENYATKGLFPVGRLDKDTVGLLVLTNDGKNAHRLLSPKHHVEKVYDVTCDKPFVDGDVDVCLRGIPMDGEMTKPCRLVIDRENPCHAFMTLTEGKFHEIKRLCAHLGKTVTFLERVRFGTLEKDDTLSRGEWRHLTDEEIRLLTRERSEDTKTENTSESLTEPQSTEKGD